jgi:hypothetical protein
MGWGLSGGCRIIYHKWLGTLLLIEFNVTPPNIDLAAHEHPPAIGVIPLIPHHPSRLGTGCKLVVLDLERSVHHARRSPHSKMLD